MRLNVVRGESKEVEERGNQSKIMVFVYWRMKWLTVYYKRERVESSGISFEGRWKGVVPNEGSIYTSIVPQCVFKDVVLVYRRSLSISEVDRIEIPTKKLFQAIEHIDCTTKPAGMLHSCMNFTEFLEFIQLVDLDFFFLQNASPKCG